MREPTASRGDLATALTGTRFGEVRWFGEIDSTNRYLVDEATAGAASGLVVVADTQTAGRGRLGRVWIAPPGASLLVSVLVDATARAEERHLVLVAAALAAIDAVAECCGFRPRLKWPNDLVVGDRKLAGLLAEATPSGRLVLGMGLNIEWDAFPREIEATATSCNREGHAAAREEILVAWLRALDARLREWDRGGAATLRADNLAASATVGRRVRLEQANGTIEGNATALTDLGHLVVQTDDGVEHTMSAGDVIHLRPTA